MTRQCCAITGHRPLHFHFKYDEMNPDCIAIKQALAKEVNALICSGVTTYYIGMCLGVDTWAAEIILKLKKESPALKLIAVHACETQANRWSLAQRERFFDILHQCDDEVFISRKYTKTCTFERNRYMVDHVQCLIAVSDGTNNGGTAYTIRYAKQVGCNIIIIPISPQTTSICPP